MEARPKRLPKLPLPLEDEVQRLAEEIVTGRLEDARRTACIEVANKLLTQVVALFKHATAGAPLPGTAPAVAPSLPVKPTGPSCVLCGALAIWQDRSAKVAPGAKFPAYCRAHAAGIAQEQREANAGAGLLAALKQAAPINDDALPQ